MTYTPIISKKDSTGEGAVDYLLPEPVKSLWSGTIAPVATGSPRFRFGVSLHGVAVDALLHTSAPLRQISTYWPSSSW